ncbi:hypothetical protein KL905_005033 [Ogataea polymorpha]|nr:hypothetical protein KL935_005066 [Ogataea polymorpha]KAG7898742.1 hypothetical protein KL907_005096 [Ogataea polymorpha]KAG7915397.1 hypothetical protein KL905_005033 [Ogataea polymorpha]
MSLGNTEIKLALLSNRLQRWSIWIEEVIFFIPKAEKLKSLEKQVSVGQEFSLKIFRNILKQNGTRFIAAGATERPCAIPYTDEDVADLVAFGSYFISNPDLVKRPRNDRTLTPYNRGTLYCAQDPLLGCMNYPFYREETM